MGSNRSRLQNGGDARKAVLEKLDRAMDDISRVIETADPTTPEEERLQLRRYHELGYLANQYRKLKRETDLFKMEERLALLETEPDDEDY